MYKLEKSPICKVQQIGDLHFLKLHKNQIRQYLMGTVSVLKMDIKGIGFPIPQEKREWICSNKFLYIKGVSSGKMSLNQNEPIVKV